MAEQNRGRLWLLTAAAAAGVLLEMKYHQHPGAAAKADASAAPVVAASGAPAAAVPPPHAATRAGIDKTLGLLEHAVQPAASNAKSPWALANGLLAFGPHFAADDERPAVDAIASHAQRRRVDGRTLYGFPPKKGDAVLEPRPAELVESMLDARVPLDQKLVAADATEITLARLVHDLQRTARLPQNDAGWHQAAWTLATLAIDARLGDRKGVQSTLDLADFSAAALSRLERDDQALTDFHGDPQGAFDPGSPLRKARLQRSGVYGYSDGGLELVQAVTESVMQSGDAAAKKRLRRQLGVLLFRYKAERHAYATLLSRHPEAALALRAQQQKFFGLLIETLARARHLGAYDVSSDGGKLLDRTMLDAAGDLGTAAKQLERSGAFKRLETIRNAHERTYRDLIGGACHAIHGLRLALETLPE